MQQMAWYYGMDPELSKGVLNEGSKIYFFTENSHREEYLYVIAQILWKK